jgi:hypothetical protein
LESPYLPPTSQRLTRLRPAAVAPELIVAQAQLEHIQAILRETNSTTTALRRLQSRIRI